MAHAVETRGTQQAFASLREPAWHGLGTVFDQPHTREEIMALAHLAGWNVTLIPLEEAALGFASFAQEHHLVTRTNPFDNSETDVLAVVGSRYEPIQNEDVLSFADVLLEGGGTWETAGSIKDGRQIFASLSFDDSVTLLDASGRADAIRTYLVVATSHDGSMPMCVFFTKVRVVCANTLNVAVKGASQMYKVRHTLNHKMYAAEAAKALSLSVAYSKTFDAQAEAMIKAEIKADAFWSLVETIYPKPTEDTKGAVKKWQNKADLIETIYLGQGDQGDTNSAITGTLWGAVNAMTERVDYYRTTRSNARSDAALVSASGFDDNATRERQKIWNAATALLPA
jgi:phage/plasmid-like protein (TIGR03299 family)